MNPYGLYIKLGILALVVVMSFSAGCHIQAGRSQKKLDKHLAADAASILRGKDIIINTERAHMAALAAVDTKLTREYSDALASRDAVIADLRTGTVRVRDRFRCPSRVPGIAARPSAGDAAPQGGLSDEDASFFVRLASEADQVALQLGACQAVVAGDRKP